MRNGGVPADWRVVPLSAGGVDLFKSPDPEGVVLGNPSIVTLPGSRIVAALDLMGPGVKKLQGPKGRVGAAGNWLQGKLFVSSDKGATWTCKNDFPFHQAQLFRMGGAIYLLGLAGDFKIIRSVDGGETWDKPSDLLPVDGDYTLTPGSVLCAKDHVYVVVMKKVARAVKDASGGSWVPVVMSAKEGSDLTNRKAWSWSEPGKPFDEFVPRECLSFFGGPVSSLPVTDPAKPGERAGVGRSAARLDWEAPHLVEIRDPAHLWFDPHGRTLHLLATAKVRRGNIAAVARVVTDDAGQMTIDGEYTFGCGRTALVPLPGGNLKFDIVYDVESRMYWLVSNMVSDSMRRDDKNIPVDDRQRLLLHFSRNLVDWHLAGCIDTGVSAKELRYCASLSIGGSDLNVVCCSGQAKPGNRGYTERVTFHAIPGFRELVY